MAKTYACDKCERAILDEISLFLVDFNYYEVGEGYKTEHRLELCETCYELLKAFNVGKDAI